MLGRIVAFELRYQLRHPLFWCLALIYFAMAVALGASDIGNLMNQGAPGITLRNAPIVILRMMPVISLLALFPMAAFITTAALRDLELDSASLFLTKPIGRLQYLGGRYLGAMLICAALLLITVAGLYAANFVPWQPADRLGLVHLQAYGYGLCMIIVPNLLLMGTMIFAVAAWSRKQTAVYLAAVFFVVTQDVVEILAFGLDMPLLSSLIEPSGVVAIEMAVRYWTISQQTTDLPSALSALGLNRLLWVGAAALLLIASISRFQLTPSASSKRGKRTAKAETKSTPTISSKHAALPRPRLSFGRSNSWRQLLRQARLEITEVVTRAPFLSLLLVGMVFVGAFALSYGAQDGVMTYPRTEFMLLAIQQAVKMTLVLILVIYAGELVHSQHGLKIADLYDASPASNRTLFAAKLLALMAISAIFLLGAALVTLAVQSASAYSAIRFDLYVGGLALIALPLLPIIALALLLQVVTNHKTVGLLLTVAILAAAFVMPKVGFEDPLYRYGSYPALRYSALAGYGPYLKPYLATMLYWNLAAALALLLAYKLWPRGRDTALKARWKRARSESSKTTLLIAGVTATAMLVCGSWVYLNNRVNNEYLDRNQQIAKFTQYEQKFQKYADLSVPTVSAVSLNIDLFPSQRMATLAGSYTLTNRTDAPIKQLALTLSPKWVERALPVLGGVSLKSLHLRPHSRLVDDDALGFYVLELEQAMAPGETLELGFTVDVAQQYFRHAQQDFLLLDNGSFFSASSFLPAVGYNIGNQNQDPVVRREQGLPPLRRAPLRGDTDAVGRNYIGADWIDFDSTVSTEAGQTVIAPGTLERQWSEGDRRYFHYRTKQPITNLLPFISGSYAIKKARWEEVEIEMLYHPEHEANIDHMIAVTQASLAYMSKHFGPYPHPQLRIVEIPSFHGQIAFSFGQVIAYSELMGYSLNLENAEYDPLAAILSHEVAHQWWNHQLVPADTQGATMIAESLCQYSAAMILGEIYGEQSVDRYREISRNFYLRGRAQERIAEMPLALVENQGYVHYGKGPLVLLQLRDAIGKDALNQALAEYLRSARFAGPPYPTSTQLLDHLRAAAPDHSALIDDLFEHISLADLRLLDATYHALDDDRFAVTLEVSGSMLRDDGHGELSKLPLDWPFEVVLYADAEQQTPIASYTRTLSGDLQTLRFETDTLAVRAAIDPGKKLVEVDAGDNQRDITLATTTTTATTQELVHAGH